MVRKKRKGQKNKRTAGNFIHAELGFLSRILWARRIAVDRVVSGGRTTSRRVDLDSCRSNPTRNLGQTRLRQSRSNPIKIIKSKDILIVGRRAHFSTLDLTVTCQNLDAEVSRRSHLVTWRKLKSERSQLIHICPWRRLHTTNFV